MMMKQVILAAGLALAAPVTGAAQNAAQTIEVLKQASCGCCAGWVVRMQEAGFTVRVRDVTSGELTAAKRASGFGEELWGCHTASVGGYTVEGHVPASDIRRLLDERPDALGIATPGMPVGSPGMEYGNQREAFSVVLVNTDGTTAVYSSYDAK